MKTRASKAPGGLFVGLSTVDLTYVVDAVPRRNQKISVPGQRIAAGGPSANAAATFAFLGGKTTLVTAMGRHPLAKVIRRDLSRFNMRVYDLASAYPGPPPISSILVHRSSGERTVVSANAAVFSPLSAVLDEKWFTGVSLLQVDGHYMSLCISAAHRARERGITVVLDSGSWKPRMSGLLPFVDIVVCSEDFRPPGCRSSKQVFDYLKARKVRRVAITRGASPIIFRDGSKRGQVAVERVAANDTLGAGDVFHGAFCYYTSMPGYGFERALADAARVATFSCRFAGTRTWMDAWSKSPKKIGGK